VPFDAFPLVKPLLHALDPETAHAWSIRALATGLVPAPRPYADPILRTRLFGRELANPIGLAAGFDKNARAFRSLYAHGFAFVEIGGVTPLPQTGNPRPRVYRLPEDAAVINRMGFPNEGAVAIARRLQGARPAGLVGVNIANNVESPDPLGDFLALARRFAPLCDYLALDVSCPNTANGRLFLDPVRLAEMLARIAALDLGLVRPAIAVKLAPEIDEVALAAGVDGIIATNTTAARPDSLRNPAKARPGGLSGAPLRGPATRMLARIARQTRGRTALIGVGGVASGADAYAKIRAGACAVELYTALIYAGTGLVAQIGRDLAALLRRDGFAKLAEAVGADVAETTVL
jgi:dihydroorotate dehydrogenase